MSQMANAHFMLQLLPAELLFLYPAEKRRLFPVRLAIAILLCIGISTLIPMGGMDTNLLAQFLTFFFQFAVSTFAMGCCFKLEPSALISSCAAGYAVQHIASRIVRIARYYGLLSQFGMGSQSIGQVKDLVPFYLLYLVFWLTIGLYSARHQCYKRADMRFNLISISIIFICVGLTRVARYFGDENSVTVSLYAIVALVMALIVQLVLSRAVELQNNNEMIKLLLQKERQQYERSKKSIDTINIKYHDLKHRLQDFHLPPDEIDAIKDAVRIYGSQIKTGNEAMDILLTENTLRLGEEGITLTYMGNGADFCFMDTMDVYSLFGNAIDNAVEAVRQLEDREKKVINIVTEKKGNLININVSNYYVGSLSFENGLPETTAKEHKDLHGFGMKSMRLIAEKYGGNLSVSAKDGVFDLCIYLMHE